MQYPMTLTIELLLVHIMAGLYLRIWFKPTKKKGTGKRKSVTAPLGVKQSSSNPVSWIFVGIVLCFLIVGSAVFYLIATKSPIEGQRVDTERIEMRIKVDLKNLVTELSQQKETRYFNISPAPNHQMVREIKGDYFYVDLLDPITKQTILFPAGEYTFNGSNKNFIQALSRFQNEVMNLAMQGGARIFIRGKADKPTFSPLTYSDQACGAESLSKIWYYPKAENSEYYYKNQFTRKYLPTAYSNSNSTAFWSEIVEFLHIAKKYDNTDLPELRSRFIQCQYKKLFPNVQTYLLEGNVADEVDDKLRNATLILFIPNSEP